MSEHPNATRVRDLVDKIMAGDLEGALDAYSEQAIYRVGGNNLVSGSYRGRQEMRDFFIRLGEITEGTMRVGVEDVVADDNHAVMFWALTADRKGKHLDARGAMAFKIDDAGKFTESWFLYNDQVAYDAFFS